MLRRIIFLILFGLSHLSHAQNENGNKYENLFITVDQRSHLTYADINLPITSAAYYATKFDMLLVFKDGRPNEICQFSYQSARFTIRDLFDPKRDLNILRNGVLQSVRKNDLAYFIFNQEIFINQSQKPKENAIFPAPWGVMVLNGAIRHIRWFIKDSSQDSYRLEDKTYLNSKEISPLILGNSFGWRKPMIKTVADHPQMLARIEAKEDGYTIKNAKKIIKEYNQWVKQNDYPRFKKYAIPEEIYRTTSSQSIDDSEITYQQVFSRVNYYNEVEAVHPNLNIAQANALFDPDSLYNLLLIYKDGRPNQEVKFTFKPHNFILKYRSPFLIRFFFDTKIPLTVIENGKETTIDKSLLTHMVLAKSYIFINNYVFDPDFKDKKETWGLVRINGPITEIKWVIVNSGSHYYNTQTYFNAVKQRKSLVNISSGWKKLYESLLSDYAELIVKINNKEKDYKLSNSVKMVVEYNEWVKKNDPERFNKYALPTGLTSLGK